MAMEKVKVKFEASWVYDANRNSKTRYTRNEGGARSTKTWSLCQLMITRAKENQKGKKVEPFVISIVRKTMVDLRSTVMKDFFNILKSMGMYHPDFHNKSECIYRFGNAEVEFFGCDDASKLHGRKRDILWINEANQLDLEDWTQLKLRTEGQIFFDYNPTDVVSWIYDLPSNECTDIPSTYLDNPFLAETIVKEIQGLKEQDETYWTVYGLGLRAASHELIYTNYEVCHPEDIPKDIEPQFGLDYGDPSPNALVACYVKENVNTVDVWLDELLYEGNLNNKELMERMDSEIGIQQPEVWADSAEPKRIEEMNNYRRSNGTGFYVHAVEKGPDSVKNGIDIVKRCRLHITQRSTNILAEIRFYKWRKFKEIILDEPVKYKNHAMDAMRYCLENVVRSLGILFDPTEDNVQMEELEAITITRRF
jgi:phage terminase large subunit